jgi:site-specific DNA-methyltransferase (adenine-specific)
MVRGDRLQPVHAKYATWDSHGARQLHPFTGDNRDAFGYWFWCALWLSQALRVVKPGGIAALFTDWRQLPATSMGLQAGGFVWRGIVPWFKPSARPAQGRFTNACEYVVWGTNGARELAGAPLPGFYQASPPRRRQHLTEKPLDVMRQLVRVAPPGGMVLDPFMGAGTTGVAALVEGRSFTGVEISAHYFVRAQRRIHSATGE